LENSLAAGVSHSISPASATMSELVPAPLSEEETREAEEYEVYDAVEDQRQ